jgi:hypothetical protein
VVERIKRDAEGQFREREKALQAKLKRREILLGIAPPRTQAEIGRHLFSMPELQ